ncbi:MAG: HAD-IIB family hydrolase [Candidatus Hodarchaeales archaeon]
MKINSIHQKIGLIFDVDGVLTKPILKPPVRSVIDPEIISLIDNLIQRNFFIAFVTGRALAWVKAHVFPHLSIIGKEKIPIFMEYGLTYWYENTLHFHDVGKQFRQNTYPKLISFIDIRAKESKIFFEPNKVYWDYPKHGSIWIEDKHAMLSIASNTIVNTKQVHLLVENIPEDLKVRLIKHHLGFDLLPNGWSKAKAIEKVKEFSTEVKQWYVFGDNPSDREMTKPLENAIFIDTKKGASKTTTKYLEEKFFD